MFEDEVAARFPALAGTIYMNTATAGVGPATAAAALRDAADAWARGRFDWQEAERAGEEARSLFGRLVGIGPDCVALVPAAAAVAGLLAAHLVRRFAHGGNIVVGAEEFTSNLYPWRVLEARGFEVRMLPFRDGGVSEAGIAAAVDRETRLVAVSAVQSATGSRADLARLREAAGETLLFVDAAQAVGSVPIDMEALRIDALAAPSHKFLVGTRGMGYGAFSPALRDALDPVWPGWKAAASPMTSFYGPDMTLSATASRLDMSLAWFNALAERESMRVLHELGPDRVHAHDAMLADRMVEALREADIPFLDHGPARRSPIVSCAPAVADAAERLREAGVIASVRAGRVRLALHLYNTAAHVEQVAELLSRS
jgi:selenocysteine lyase/cysteine desulfurase